MPLAKMEFSNYNLPLGCMNADIGTQIGKSIGKVVQCDVDKEGNAWGTIFWIRIEIDLLKSLSRGKTINVKGDQLWIPLTYEKIPRVFFRCGKIIHDRRSCEGVRNATPISNGQDGLWL